MLLLHCSTDQFGKLWNSVSYSDKFDALFLRTLFYIPRTEVFVLISMALLAMAVEKGGTTTWKVQSKVKAIFPVFLSWSLFYTAFSFLKAWQGGYSASFWEETHSIGYWLEAALLGHAKYHLHFLPALMALLLVAPIFLRRQSYLFFPIGIALVVLRYFVDQWLYIRFWGWEGLAYLVALSRFVSYIGYTLLAAGMVGIVRKCDKEGRVWVASSAATILALCVCIKFLSVDGSPIAMFRTESFPRFVADYLSPVCLSAIALSVPPMSWTLPKPMIRSAFGIYLSHPIVIDLVEVSGLTDGMLPVQELATKATMAIIGTFGLCLWLQNRPSLSWVIGLGQFPGFQSATERRATV